MHFNVTFSSYYSLKAIILCNFVAVMKKISFLLIAAGLMVVSPCAAQDKVEASVSADIVSQYVWRGLDLGSGSIQPSVDVSWKGLSLSAWGSVGFVDRHDNKELDLTLSYTIGGFSAGLIDYWNTENNPNYFNYKARNTSHVFEAFVGYDFGFLSASWQTIFGGNDGVNNHGHRAYSSYFELAAPFRFATCDWQAAVGCVPYATDYYGTSKFAVTNVSLRVEKAIRITDHFSLPIFGQLVANPNSEKAYFVFGLSLRP